MTIAHRLAKHPESILAQTVPKTYPFQITHADELDVLFFDELYDLAQAIDHLGQGTLESERKWWILKPALADKGQGIRLFDSKDSLQAILASFEDDSDDEYDERIAGADQSTKVNLSAMRDWVIQVPLSSDLLSISC